ncbi:uncharacterized protein LOC126203910 [Schistocerca nitens]|uniref:uncharacterized protein LOC126203910 n=1 Tax=Schistocerca nitens TaxID=7011 RepID=UPI00211738DD|nr:uncharacterized protein LOC126203910 [Schistocerca nitens]
MSVNSFEMLLNMIGETTSKRNTKMRECISAEEKLAVTLRHLGTGNSMRSLHFEFLLVRSTIADIIRDTCTSKWEMLKVEYMKPPTTEEWKNISDKYEKTADFPHCVGSIDGKHVRIVKPWTSGSEFYNYKKYFSIVLMAIVDSKYCFRFIDVAAFGQGDSNMFKATELGKTLYQQALNLSEAAPLPNDPCGLKIPCVFVVDEAFAMSEHLMRPYPAKNLTNKQKVFNYRLSRARRYVECAFGILSNKWRYFHRPVDVNVDVADTIVQACCVLHNFVRQHDGYNFEDTLICRMESIPAHGTKGTVSGKSIKDHLADYFCSPQGSVPLQDHYANFFG